MPELPLPSTVFVYKTFLGADPAANAEVTAAVPAGKWWWLLAVTVSLAQGATQTPQPILQIDDGTNLLFEGFGSSAAQAVSTTCRYTWAAGLPLSAQVGATTNVHSTAPLPGKLLLAAGSHIKTSTIGIGANSDYGVPNLYVIELG
jgi:hypothetical protein